MIMQLPTISTMLHFHSQQPLQQKFFTYNNNCNKNKTNKEENNALFLLTIITMRKVSTHNNHRNKNEINKEEKGKQKVRRRGLLSHQKKACHEGRDGM
jgi:hypothetical protein